MYVWNRGMSICVLVEGNIENVQTKKTIVAPRLTIVFDGCKFSMLPSTTRNKCFIILNIIYKQHSRKSEFLTV